MPFFGARVGVKLLMGLPLKELCQLPHIPHQGQEQVLRLVAMVPVSFNSKLSTEAVDVLQSGSRLKPKAASMSSAPEFPHFPHLSPSTADTPAALQPSLY